MVDRPTPWQVQLLSPKPSPPPPPPPVADNAPPAPPQTVSGAGSITGTRLVSTWRRERPSSCSSWATASSRTAPTGTVCGLTQQRGARPVDGDSNGVKCRGYDTRSTREGDYCGYCKALALQTGTLRCAHLAPFHAHACHFLVAHRGERDATRWRPTRSCAGAALGGPLLHVDGEERALDYDNPDPETGMAPPKVDRLGDPLYKQVPAYCSPNASRTQRSGVHGHQVHAPAGSALLREQVCAAAALRRVGRRHRDVPRQPDARACEQCDLNCDACSAAVHQQESCATSPRSAKCSFALHHSGRACKPCTRATSGWTSASRWGAMRTERRPAQPTAQLGGEVPHPHSEQHRHAHSAAQL